MTEPRPSASATPIDSFSFESPAPNEGGADLIERVLDATLSQQNKDWVTPAEVVALIDVARSHGDEADVRPVAAALVAALLHTNYSRLSLPSGSLDAIAIKLGETLCEAPSTLPRLQRMWDQLRSLAT